jgi:flagellar biosynthesis/type III secretory pathway protein FliH
VVWNPIVPNWNIAETVQQWYADAKRQGMQQGMQQGIQQGIQQGQLEGDRLLLKFQLQAKFGYLSPHLEKQFEDFNAEQLFHCAKRLLIATTLEEVFTELP